MKKCWNRLGFHVDNDWGKKRGGELIAHSRIETRRRQAFEDSHARFESAGYPLQVFLIHTTGKNKCTACATLFAQLCLHFAWGFVKTRVCVLLGPRLSHFDGSPLEISFHPFQKEVQNLRIIWALPLTTRGNILGVEYATSNGFM